MSDEHTKLSVLAGNGDGPSSTPTTPSLASTGGGDGEDEGAILNDLDTVIEPVIGTRPDFSAVSASIRRARDNASTKRAHALEQEAMDVGISLAGDFEPQSDEEEEKPNVFIGWN